MNSSQSSPSAGSSSTQLAGRRLLAVEEEELRHIVLDIHDGLVQNVFAALSQLALCRTQLAHHSAAQAELGEHLERVAGLLEASLAELRVFVGAFRPPDFVHRDLLAVLEGLVAQHEALTGSAVELSADQPLPPVSLPNKIALYRILQEALANVDRHAGVKMARVRLWADESRIFLEVLDDGQGFQPPPLSGPSATEREEHIGLRGMRERAALAGGQLCIESAPGHGTRVNVEVPRDV
ncbi:MAG: sensor histidine kinase [Chloroflexi bacterium]|nr:sensor histidine kinase [Chloroflexota bacterium]MBI3764782.1 sensor histidine kinase [Chloroflexota bacterium]